MKKLLLILLCLPMIFISCEKEEENDILIDPISLYNIWSIDSESSFIEKGVLGGNYFDINTNTEYINSVEETQFIEKSLEYTITTGQSTNFKSRFWSFNENQNLIETYLDYNDVAYNVSQHSYLRNSDTLEINFQPNYPQSFLINQLDNNNLEIISIKNDTTFFPIFDVSGIYQDTIMYNIHSKKYRFTKQ